MIPAYAGDRRVAMRTGGQTYYLFLDHLGGTHITASGTNGAELGKLLYRPWGEKRVNTGTTLTTWRFTGQREDATIGLYYYGARYYDSALGRFAQADTIVPNPGDPQSLNRYSYTLNNPVRYTDPTGMFSEDEITKYLGVTTWDDVLAFFEEGGELEGRWGWLEVLHEAGVGSTVQALEGWGPWTQGLVDDHTVFAGSFVDQDGQLLVQTASGEVTAANLVGLMGNAYYTKQSENLSSGRQIYADKQYNHLRIYPRNLDGNPIALWHTAEAAGMGTALYALGIGMAGIGVGLCTTLVGCVAGAELIIGSGASIGSGLMIHYGLILELEHQHVFEYGP